MDPERKSIHGVRIIFYGNAYVTEDDSQTGFCIGLVLLLSAVRTTCANWSEVTQPQDKPKRMRSRISSSQAIWSGLRSSAIVGKSIWVRLFCVGGPEGSRRGCERHGKSYLTRRRRGEEGDGAAR